MSTSDLVWIIDNYSNQKVILKGNHKIKTFQRTGKDINEDGTVFLTKKGYNVNAFHHGTLIYNIDRPLVEFHINELIKSINSGNSDFVHKTGKFIKKSNDGEKIYTIYNRYTFGYDELNVATLTSKNDNRNIKIINSEPRVGDHQYALKIVDKGTGYLDAFGLYW